MDYELLKTLHVIGVILLLGNVTVTASWKAYADLSEDPVKIAFAVRAVVLADYLWTSSGIVLTMGAGYAMAHVAGIPLFEDGWMIWSQALFLAAGLMWMFLIVPSQIRMSRMSRAFVAGEPVPWAYWRESRWWMLCGSIATVPLTAAVYVMIAKPDW
jgi:uncharacterized membrane protein